MLLFLDKFTVKSSHCDGVSPIEVVWLGSLILRWSDWLFLLKAVNSLLSFRNEDIVVQSWLTLLACIFLYS